MYGSFEIVDEPVGVPLVDRVGCRLLRPGLEERPLRLAPVLQIGRGNVFPIVSVGACPARFEHHDLQARLGETPGGPSTGRAGSNDNGVVLGLGSRRVSHTR